jgi:AcrR family transcriptional regulator
VRAAASQNKRDLIMMAAERLFANRRFHEITLDEVARAAGVGKGTIYLYFAGKDDLFFQVATSGYTQLCAIVERGVGAGVSFQAGLLPVCREISAFFQRRRQLLRMMQTEDGRMARQHGAMHERWLAHRRQLISALGTMFAAGVREGAIRADVAPEALAALLLSMLRARARELEAPDLVALETLVELFLFGATPAGSSVRRTGDEGGHT